MVPNPVTRAFVNPTILVSRPFEKKSERKKIKGGGREGGGGEALMKKKLERKNI